MICVKVLENNEAQLIGQNVDGGEVMSSFELEELCLAMLDELPELSYDYLGNTIVQKLFTLVESSLVKLMMVKEVAPYLTQLGIHKMGHGQYKNYQFMSFRLPTDVSHWC